MGTMWHRWGPVIWKWLQGDEEMAGWKPEVTWWTYENGKMLMQGNECRGDPLEGVGVKPGVRGRLRRATENERKMPGRSGIFLSARNINVRCVLPLPSQPFSSFNLPHLPSQPPPAPSTPPPAALLNLPTSPLPLLCLPRVVPVVILLSETREGHGTHGDAGCSVTMVSPANRNGAKSGTRMCACVCTGVYGCGCERALLSASTRLGNGCLAGLPDLSQPLLSQTTRFSWPSAAAQGHTPVSLIKTQPWHTHTHTHTHCTLVHHTRAHTPRRSAA